MKKLALLFALILCGSIRAETIKLDGVVAVVGSSAVLRSDVEAYARELRQQGMDQERALEGLLVQKLLYNQAVIDSVEISADDVARRAEEHLQGLIEQSGGITALEKLYHMPVFSVREMLRQRYEEQAYAQSMQMTVAGDLRVTPAEVEKFYRAMDPDSIPVIPRQWTYAHITKFPASMKEARERTRERLLEMRERALSGQSRFDILARMYSIHPSAMQGGALDPQPLSAFEATFSDALSELREGGVSEVIENREGYNLLQLVEVKGRMYHVRRILLRPVYATDELVAPMRTLDSVANLVRKDSLTWNDAAMRYSDDEYSKMNGGIVSNHDLLQAMGYQNARYTETRFVEEDFAPGGGRSVADFTAIQALGEGEISPSYLTQDLMGNELAKIVKLVRMIPEHPASLEEDYIRIEMLALNAKQERVFTEWLNEKIRSMYVYIDPEFRSASFENKNWVR